MKLKHVGERPTHTITLIDFKKKIWEEEYPDGRKRIWNKRQLISGCGGIIVTMRLLMNCIYCPTCKEYFNKDQWEEI